MSTAILYRAAALFNGRSPSPISDAGMVVENGRITFVGPFSEVSPQYVGHVEDLADLTVLPGLIDAHAHLMLDGSEDPFGTLLRRTDDLVLLKIADNGRRALEAGVTTLRDCGCRAHLSLAYRQAVDDGNVVGPNVVASDRVVTTRQGHLYFIAVEASGTAEVREAVRRQAKAGADFIKLIGSGGRMTPGQTNMRRHSQYTDDEIRAAIDEAHRLGLRVAVHAHSTDAIEIAAEAGADSIEHCLWLGTEGLLYSERAVDAMARRGTYVVLTLARFFPEPGSGVAPDEMIPDFDMIAPLYARMKNAGVTFVAGGDTGASNTPFGTFVRNLELMCRFGMSPAEAITAATATAAECLDRADIGVLEPGRRADFIAVRGSPLDDVRALWDVRHVFRSGARVKGASTPLNLTSSGGQP